MLGGTKVQKDDIRLEAYGTVDELNAFIGHLHDHDINENHKKVLLAIQNQLLIWEAFCLLMGKNQKLNCQN